LLESRIFDGYPEQEDDYDHYNEYDYDPVGHELHMENLMQRLHNGDFDEPIYRDIR
jgi:hypothetical protein